VQTARSGRASASANASASAPASGAAARKVPRATEQQIKEAAAKGPDAVEQLMQQFPGDTELLKVLGRAQMAANDQAAAVETYKKLLAVEPKAADDVELGQNLVLACQAETASEAAYGALEGDMGSRGMDLLYWLAYESKAAARYQLRAARSLAKKEVRERGSPALQIAFEFRTASGCEGKLKLLDRAGQEGDRRMVPLLQPLFYDRGCGFLGMQDCWKCLRKGSMLATTLKEIESRIPDAGRN
jgi:predicted Zn-dependent protease